MAFNPNSQLARLFGVSTPLRDHDPFVPPIVACMSPRAEGTWWLAFILSFLWLNIGGMSRFQTYSDKETWGLRSFSELTQQITARPDDSHAQPMSTSTKSLYIMLMTNGARDMRMFLFARTHHMCPWRWVQCARHVARGVLLLGARYARHAGESAREGLRQGKRRR